MSIEYLWFGNKRNGFLAFANLRSLIQQNPRLGFQNRCFSLCTRHMLSKKQLIFVAKGAIKTLELSGPKTTCRTWQDKVDG